MSKNSIDVDVVTKSTKFKGDYVNVHTCYAGPGARPDSIVIDAVVERGGHEEHNAIFFTPLQARRIAKAILKAARVVERR